MCSPDEIFGKPSDPPEDEEYEPTTWIHWLTHPRGMSPTHQFLNNVKAGATVALVNVPLSISLCLASGGTPTQGIVTAVWAGLVSGIFSSSHFNVVGPTGALSGMLSSVAMVHGPEILPIMAIYTSIILFVFSIFKADRFIRYVSTAVAHGFSVGVAFIIAIAQIPSAFGLKNVAAKDHAIDKIEEAMRHMDTLSVTDTLLFFGTLIPFFFAAKWNPRVPWQIVFATIGICFGLMSTPKTFMLLRDKYPNLNLSLVSFISFEIRPDFFSADVILYSFGTAVVALLETLISSQIANTVAHDKKNLNYSSNRDAYGLALSNLVPGLLGGIPATAALARTSLNLRAGAYSRMAGLYGTVVIAFLSSVLLPYFEFLPMPTIAAILVMVAYRLIDFHELWELKVTDAENTYAFVITFATCIFSDTFVGLLVGVCLGVYLNYSHGQERDIPMRLGTEPEIQLHNTPHVFVVEVRCKVVFLNAMHVRECFREHEAQILQLYESRMSAENAASPAGGPTEGGFDECGSPRLVVAKGPLPMPKVIIDLTHCPGIDYDGSRLLGELIDTYRKRGWRVDAAGLKHHTQKSLACCSQIHDYAEV